MLTSLLLSVISNSTDFSVSRISENLNWHKLKMRHWIRSLRLKRHIAMVSVPWPLCDECGYFRSVPACSTLSAPKPPSLIYLLCAVQELCRNIVLFSIRTSVRDSIIYLWRRGHLWSHQTPRSASTARTKKLFYATKSFLLKRYFVPSPCLATILFSYQIGQWESFCQDLSEPMALGLGFFSPLSFLTWNNKPCRLYIREQYFTNCRVTTMLLALPFCWELQQHWRTEVGLPLQ